MSSFTLATQGHYESPASASSISTTVDIPSGTDGAYIFWGFDDQGTTSRTFTVTLDGSSVGIVDVARKADAISNHSHAAHYIPNPTPGTGIVLAVSASPAFATRPYRVGVILATGLHASTPYDNASVFENATATSTSRSTPSEVGDDVLSCVCADGRSVATGDWNPAGAQFFGEWNTNGALYFAIARYAGVAGNVASGWAWGGSSINASEIAFNVNTAAAGGGPPTENLFYRRRR